MRKWLNRLIYAETSSTEVAIVITLIFAMFLLAWKVP